MSQQSLASAMGYKTRSTIAKIESGENDVSQKKLKKFAEVLDTTVASLISCDILTSYNPPVSVPRFSAERSKNIVVILAGGENCSTRQNIPTQFVSAQGKPILVYCMEVYQSHPSIDDILIVCLKGWEKIVQDYAQQYGITKLRSVITSGTSGTASLENARKYMADKYRPEDLVIIHEATRPLFYTETISALLQACEEQGSATFCHSMNEYVQFNISQNKAEYMDRNSIIALQSPEAHRFGLFQEVFERARLQGHHLIESCFTMLMYHMGYKVNFLRGSVNNVKIATDADIAAFCAHIRT